MYPIQQLSLGRHIIWNQLIIDFNVIIFKKLINKMKCLCLNCKPQTGKIQHKHF